MERVGWLLEHEELRGINKGGDSNEAPRHLVRGKQPSRRPGGASRRRAGAARRAGGATTVACPPPAGGAHPRFDRPLEVWPAPLRLRARLVVRWRWRVTENKQCLSTLVYPSTREGPGSVAGRAGLFVGIGSPTMF